MNLKVSTKPIVRIFRKRLNMKNKILKMMTLAVGSFGLIASVNASAIADLVEKDFAEQDENGVYILKKETALDLEIEAGEDAVIDLKGFKFTSEDDANSAIYVKDSGKLTIKDSVGTGVITYRDSATNNGSSYAPVINNEGTLIFEKGIILVTKGADAQKATGIYNTGALEFIDGKIETKINFAYGITNKGSAVIKGGEFVQGDLFTVILNDKDLEISGGNFKATKEGAYSLISNVDDADGDGVGNIKVTGGTFDSKKVFHGNAAKVALENYSDITVMGGNFPNAEARANVTKYLAEDFELTAEGEAITDADYEEYNTLLEEALKEVKETTKYTEESLKALQEVIDEAQKLAKDLKSNEQSQIDEVVNKLETAIKNLKLIEQDVVDEEKDKDDTPTKNPNTFDGVLSYVILFLVAGSLGVATKKLLK